MGRFISEDSDEGEFEDPLSLNLYTYCEGNPIMNTDPSGNAAVAVEGAGRIKVTEVSSNLINFLCLYETFAPKPYYATDIEKQEGKRTIGYGHLIQLGEKLTSLSKGEAKSLLLKDVQEREAAVNKLIGGRAITQEQFDALVSFEFNTDKLDESDLLKDFNQGDISSKTIKRDLLQYTRQGNKHLAGLWARRMGEWEIFFKGDYKKNIDYRNAPKKPWWN